MSYMIFADHENKTVYQRVDGVYTSADVRQSNFQIKSMDAANDYRLLFDFRELRFLDVPDVFLESLGARIRTELPVRYRAFVVPPRFFDQIQTFASHAASSFRNVQVFTDFGEACNWLLISETDLWSNYSAETELAVTVSA